MTENELNHNLTPHDLRAINDELVVALRTEDPQDIEDLILQLVNKRDDAVQRHLALLPPDDARAFAQNELPINEKLLNLVQTLLDSAKDDMTQFVRSQSAIKKYK